MTMNTAAIDTSTLQRVGGQLGSNTAGILQDDSGRRYYVKTLESVAHARNELIAARLYQLAGAPTLTYVPTQAPEQIATVWVTLDKSCVAHFSARLFAAMGRDAIHQAIMKVVQIPDAQIRQCILDSGGAPSLADKMIARKHDMAQRLLAESAATTATT